MAQLTALASHQCVPGLNSGPMSIIEYVGSVCCWFLSLLLGIMLAEIKVYQCYRDTGTQMGMQLTIFWAIESFYWSL